MGWTKIFGNDGLYRFGNEFDFVSARKGFPFRRGDLSETMLFFNRSKSRFHLRDSHDDLIFADAGFQFRRGRLKLRDRCGEKVVMFGW